MPRFVISIAARLASRFGLMRRSGSWAFLVPCVTRSMRGIMSESTNCSTSVSFGSEPNTWRQAFSLPCSVSSTTPIQNGPSKNTVNFTFYSPFVIKSEGHPKGGKVTDPDHLHAGTFGLPTENCVFTLLPEYIAIERSSQEEIVIEISR